VNVEANPLLIKAFQTQRPEDVNLNVAVADKPGSMSFFIFGDRSGINTLDESRARSLEATSRFKIQRTIDIQAVTIAQIVDQHCGGIFPDFLSLDVEGLDLSILRTIDFQKSKPKLICVEGNTKQERASYTDLLSSNGYHLYFRAAVNLFFVDGQFLPMLQA
jgi:FkbM family methyltransferase